MRRPGPTDRPAHRARLARASWLAALALALAACGAPGVPPGLQLTLGTASVAVLRGASADVQVDLTRLGGAAGDVTLSVTGLPANVTASFAPPTLSGGTLTSTLTLTVGAGAGEATTALTVTGTSGSLSDDASLSLEVTSLTVVGRVLGIVGRPLIGATVSSQGETDFTDGTGAFTLTGLSVPYEVVVSSALGDGGLHVYEGMTSASPVLRPVFALFDVPTPPYGTTVSGNLVAGALGAGEAVVVCLEGVAVPIYGCDALSVGDTAYTVSADWFDGAIAAARIHAFHLTVDADGVPVTFLGYETIAINLEDGLGVLVDLAFDPVTSAVLAGTGTMPPAWPNGALIVWVRFGPNLSMPLTSFEFLGGDFQVPVPTLPGLSYDVLFGATDGGGAAIYTWKVDRGLAAGDLTLDAPAQAVAPADGATGVDLTTSFQSTAAGGGSRSYIWSPDMVAGPVLARTTSSTDVTIPDPATGGLPYPAGAAYEWNVIGHGGAAPDAAAAGGFVDFFDVLNAANLGGSGLRSDGTVAVPTSYLAFTFAP